MRYLSILLMLSGCATTGLTDIVQQDVHQEELQIICSSGGKPIYPVYGCKRASFGRCYVYILTLEEHPSKDEYEDTVQHERRHCIEGHFHHTG